MSTLLKRPLLPARHLGLLVLMGTACNAVLAESAACTTGLLARGVEAHCAVPGAPEPTSWRFKAHLVGSHDDTEIALRSAALNGVPLACIEGSKTESRFEDGDVTLDCRFTAPARAAAGRLTVQLALYHVQVDRFELVAD